jgi:hypothetical protein
MVITEVERKSPIRINPQDTLLEAKQPEVAIDSGQPDVRRDRTPIKRTGDIAAFDRLRWCRGEST